MFDLNVQYDLNKFQLRAKLQTSAQRVAIIGASGSGKSVLLRVLAGLESRQSIQSIPSNHIFINHINYLNNLNNLNNLNKPKIGLMFQDYALFPHLTVGQNIAFGLHLGFFQAPKKSFCEQTQFWLEKMQLNSVAYHYPYQISGGQKQRTALARTCIIRPNVLFLDEPFSALDTELRQQMRELVFDLQRELSIPMLLVSHDMEDTKILADEIWVMNQGQLFPY